MLRFLVPSARWKPFQWDTLVVVPFHWSGQCLEMAFLLVQYEDKTGLAARSLTKVWR